MSTVFRTRKDCSTVPRTLQDQQTVPVFTVVSGAACERRIGVDTCTIKLFPSRDQVNYFLDSPCPG